MIIPSYGQYIHLGWPYCFVPERNAILKPAGKKFEALVFHTVYNRTVLRELMHPGSVYITVVREPKAHLLSSYRYFHLPQLSSFTDVKKGFQLFLNDPKRYDKLSDWMVERGNNVHVRSLTRNLQSAGLGLKYKDFENSTVIKGFVKNIEAEFEIILVLERLSESLVLMKRKLGWSLQDIIKVDKNHQVLANWNYSNLSKDAPDKAYAWNNADTLLYKMANDKLDRLRHGEEKLNEEMELYNRVNSRVTSYCGELAVWNTSVPYYPPPLVVEKSEFNNEFIVDREFCVLLLLNESDLSFLFKCKQYPDRKDCRENIAYARNLRMILSGHVEPIDNFQ